LAGNRELLLFLLAVFVGGAGLAVMNNYLFLYLSDLGAGKGLMGFSLTVATLSEMPVLFFSGRLLERWRPTGLLVVSLLAYAARAFAYSIMGTPELVLPIQLLHGLTFALMWAAGVTYMARVAPAGMETTAQGLFGGVMIGLGGAAGGFFGGFLYDATGPVVMFRLASLAALATALLVRFVSNMGTNNKRA
jgi:PPP family 3-phenylpropionic acid transporter